MWELTTVIMGNSVYDNSKGKMWDDTGSVAQQTGS